MKKWLLWGGLTLLVLVIGISFCLSKIIHPLQYESEIKAAAATYNVEPALIAAIINAESSFDKDKISPKNAIGLMQVLPSTAEYITKEVTDLFDAATNINVGTRYLAYLINKFNDVDTALFAYNAGEGNVARWLAEQNCQALTTCPFPETNAYVAKVKKNYQYYRHRI